MTLSARMPFQHTFSTLKGIKKMATTQTAATTRLASIKTIKSGGHGARTRNSFRSTTFPVWPLAIRLPSGGPQF